MLIFIKSQYLALIVSGRKTTTIRQWKTCRITPGAVLSFNGKVRCVVTLVEQRRLGDLTEADCHADGFASYRDFARAFRSYYPATSLNSLVWILHFASPTQ